METRLEILKRSIDTGELVELYTDRENTDRFNVGRILAMDDEFYAVWFICADGRYEAIAVRPLSEVFMVCAETEYVQCTAMLAEEMECGFSPETNRDLRVQLLEYAAHRNKMVRIELLRSDNWDVMGFVESAGEEVSVCCLTDEGRPDGVCAFGLEDITEISCDGEDERKIARLASLRQNSK